MSAQPLPGISEGAAIEGISRRLCETVSQWRYEDLPPDVVRMVKLLTLDTLGVIGGAARAPGIAEIAGRFAKWERDGSATALIGKARHSPPHAALANGAAAHGLDFDDMHDPARIHAFCIALPTMLATAEDVGGVDGRRFILALAVAAEVHARLGFTCYNCLGRGWHPTMTLGVLAGALGAGRVLGLDADGLLNALGLALHQACGTAQCMYDGVLGKRLGAGLAARGAVTAAFLAQDGITGPFRPLEGDGGLFRLFERGEVEPEQLLLDIGRDWRIRGFAVKPYPCCRCNHTTIDLAFELRRRGIAPRNVEAVEIRLPQVNYQTVGQPYQAARDSVVHAQFNVAYSFARALSDGRVDLRTYTRPSITDPAVARLAERVSVLADASEEPTAMEPSKVRVTLRDGGTVAVEGRRIKGGPDAPMTEEEILDKFRGCVEFGLGLPARTADRYAARVLAAEDLDDVAVLAREFPEPAR